MKNKDALAEAQDQAQPTALDNCNLAEVSVVGSSETATTTLAPAKCEEGVYTILQDYNRPGLVTVFKLDATATQEVDDQSPLSAEERAMLESCEAIIDEAMPAYYMIGEALATIMKGRLYREKHATFEKYCLARWNFGRAQAYRYVKAADAYSDLKTVAQAGDIALPTTERGMRLVAKVGGHEDRVKLLKLAAEEAQGKRPTLKNYESAAKRVKEERQAARAGASPIIEVEAEVEIEEEAPQSNLETTEDRTQTVSAPIEKPVVTPEQLYDLIEEIQSEIDEIGTMQATVNQLGTLRSMLKAYIEQTNRSAENQNN